MEFSDTLIPFLEYIRLASLVEDKAPCTGVQKTHYVYGGVYHGAKFCLNAAGAEVDCADECSRLAEIDYLARMAAYRLKMILAICLLVVFCFIIHCAAVTAVDYALQYYAEVRMRQAEAEREARREAALAQARRIGEILRRFRREFAQSETEDPHDQHPTQQIVVDFHTHLDIR